MRFQSAGAYASLLLFSGRALGAVRGSPTNSTIPTGDEEACEPDETVTSAVLPSSASAFSGSASILPGSASKVLSLAPSGSASAIAQVNGSTGAAGEEYTTLTVLTTSIRTVLSCAATVTDCPANSASLSHLASSAPEQISTILVTDTIQLATTICPVTAAQAVSSSVYSAAATGGITGITVVSPQTSVAALPTVSPSGLGNGVGPSGIPSSILSSSTIAAGPSLSGGAGPSGLPTVSIGGFSASGSIQASVFPSAFASGSVAVPIPSGSGIAPIQSSSPQSSPPPQNNGTAGAASSQVVPQPPFGSASARPYPVGNYSIPSVQQITSTVYATNVYTVTSCAASVTNCPARGSVATEVVPVSTTVFASTLASSEVAALSSSYSSAVAFSSAAAITGAPATSASEEQTTLTVQITQMHTVISCAASITNCPAASNTAAVANAISSMGSSAIQTVVVTSVIGETTTICPVAQASSVSSQVVASMSSAVVTTIVAGSTSYYIPSPTSVPAPEVATSTAQAISVQASSTAIILSTSPAVSVVTITLSGGVESTATSSYDVTNTFTSVVPAQTTQTLHSTVISSSIVQVPTIVTITVSGVAQESSTVVESTSIFSSIVPALPTASASGVVSNVQSSATVISVIPASSIITTIVSGVEQKSTSVYQLTQTITAAASASSSVLAVASSGVASSGVISSAIVAGSPSNSAIYETQTISSQLPVETIVTVTLGSQVLTSTVSVSAAIQTPATTAPPIVSTAYVTVGGGTVLTSTYTASEVVAQNTVTLTMTGGAGIVSTYTMTVSQATTITQMASNPTPTLAGQCVPSTVTLVSVSTVCARNGNACATATNLPLIRF